MRHCCISLFLVSSMLLGAGTCHARVFLRWRSDRDTTRAMEAAGGKNAYEAEVTVNDRPGKLTVFSFRKSATAVMAEVSRACPGTQVVAHGGSMGYAVSTAGARTLKWLAVQPTDTLHTLLFRLDTETTTRQRRPSTAAGTGEGNMPAYPGARAVFSAANSDTHTTLAAYRGRASARDVHAFYTAQLAAAGWHAALPIRGNMACYIQENGICCVMVEPTETAGESKITVLRKRLAIE